MSNGGDGKRLAAIVGSGQDIYGLGMLPTHRASMKLCDTENKTRNCAAGRLGDLDKPQAGRDIVVVCFGALVLRGGKAPMMKGTWCPDTR
eukprot:scaffold3505_cov170-Amphora_coffeaeformis.AAC.4